MVESDQTAHAPRATDRATVSDPAATETRAETSDAAPEAGWPDEYLIYRAVGTIRVVSGAIKYDHEVTPEWFLRFDDAFTRLSVNGYDREVGGIGFGVGDHRDGALDEGVSLLNFWFPRGEGGTLNVPVEFGRPVPWDQLAEGEAISVSGSNTSEDFDVTLRTPVPDHLVVQATGEDGDRIEVEVKGWPLRHLQSQAAAPATFWLRIAAELGDGSGSVTGRVDFRRLD